MGLYLTSIEKNFILRSFNFDRHITLADIGSGGGKYSILGLQKNAYVISLDRDPDSLKWLSYRNSSSNAILGDAGALPIGENTVDYILLIEIFDYASDPNTLLKECHRILKRQGLLIFSFGNTSSLKSKLKQLRKEQYIQYVCSYREVIRLLNDFNFKIIRKEGYNWLFFDRHSDNKFIPFLGRWVKALRLERLLSLSPWIILCVSKGD